MRPMRRRLVTTLLILAALAGACVYLARAWDQACGPRNNMGDCSFTLGTMG